MNAQLTFAKPGDADLLGPDLSLLPALADQIAELDRVKAGDDVDEYVITWLAISDLNGGGGSAFWGNDDHPEARAQLQTGVHCDSQEHARRERWQALRDHSLQVDGFRIAMERELLRRWRYCDNRRAPWWEIKAVVRAFMATNGRLLLPPDPRRRGQPVELSFDTRGLLKGAWTDADMCAAKAMNRMLQRHRAHSKILRIVKALGTKTDNGWIVLAGKDQG
jgi:hypothetical protein